MAHTVIIDPKVIRRRSESGNIVTAAPVVSVKLPMQKRPRRNSNVSTGSNTTVTSGEVTQKEVAAAVQQGPELVLLSLRTLGTISTPSATLLPLLHRIVLPYLTASEEYIRCEAATTCLKLIPSPLVSFRARTPTAITTEYVLKKLLDTAVADRHVSVRLAIMKHLAYKIDFDRFLCQSHHIDTMMFLMSDDCYDLRVCTLAVLGRLANLNPAVILPRLRQV